MSSIEIASEVPLWVLYSFYIIVIAFSTIAVAGAAVNQPIPLEKVGFPIYKDRILYSPSCIAFHAERTIPGIISMDKFTDTRLASCFPLDTFGARLILDYAADTHLTSRISYINKGVYDLGKPLCFSRKYECTTIRQHVLVSDATGKLYRGRITFDMVLEAV